MNYSLRLYVQKITKLPTIPATAQEIMRLVSDEMVTVEALEEIVGKDPPIAAKILSVANSAFFGFKYPADTVSDAIVRIGLNNLRNIALGISIMSVFENGNSGHIFDYEKIYHHSVLVGSTATLISKQLSLKIANEVFINGMLHDIGYLVLSSYFSDSYASVLTEFERGTPLLEAEKRVLNFTHSDVGTWLADKWNLPKSIVNTICYHHTPSQAKTYQEYISVTHLADYLTTRNVMSITNEDPKYILDESALQVLGISIKDLTDLEAMLNEQAMPENMIK